MIELDNNVYGMSKVSTKYQITIPSDLRRKHRIDIGDRIIFKDNNGTIIIEKA